MDDYRDDGRARKRQKLSTDAASDLHARHTDDVPTADELPGFPTLRRSISPPLVQGRPGRTVTQTGKVVTRTAKSEEKQSQGNEADTLPLTRTRKVVPSPFQLTRIRDLPAENNVDTVSLRDILGDPLIREVWHFNYLFDLDFLM